MKVLIFKTNIIQPEWKPKVSVCLEKCGTKIFNWDIDFHDENFTLRVVGSGFTASEIVEALRNGGFECEEMV